MVVINARRYKALRYKHPLLYIQFCLKERLANKGYPVWRLAVFVIIKFWLS